MLFSMRWRARPDRLSSPPTGESVRQPELAMPRLSEASVVIVAALRRVASADSNLSFITPL
jgi:hypothetical protein